MAEYQRCCAGEECPSTYGPGKSFLVGNDDIRKWPCGCYGHKDCQKDGLPCEEHTDTAERVRRSRDEQVGVDSYAILGLSHARNIHASFERVNDLVRQRHRHDKGYTPCRLTTRRRRLQHRSGGWLKMLAQRRISFTLPTRLSLFVRTALSSLACMEYGC